jgi:hypothetical protein
MNRLIKNLTSQAKGAVWVQTHIFSPHPRLRHTFSPASLNIIFFLPHDLTATKFGKS